MKQKIINYIRAGYPGLYLVSHEEQRVALEMTRIAQELKYNLVFWSVRIKPAGGHSNCRSHKNTTDLPDYSAAFAYSSFLCLVRDFGVYFSRAGCYLVLAEQGFEV
jgi:hypothetical protein